MRILRNDSRIGIFLDLNLKCGNTVLLENLQLMSNDKFKSIAHRVLASRVGPRVSVACFFTTGHSFSSRIYGPIKELLSEDNPARYRETSVREYAVHYDEIGIGGKSALSDFRI